MRSFWFVLMAGAAMATPIAYTIRRHGVIGAGDLFVDWLDRLVSDDRDVARCAGGHPAGHEFVQRSHVTVLGPKAVQQ